MTAPGRQTESPAGQPYVVIPEGVLLQRVGGEMVLLHLDRGQYYGLDEVGVRMLDLACTLDNPAAVVAQLATEYDATPDMLQRDLEALLIRLTELGLVVRANA